MAIKVIPEPDITITQREYDHLHKEWLSGQEFNTKPSSLEDYIRARIDEYRFKKYQAESMRNIYAPPN